MLNDPTSGGKEIVYTVVTRSKELGNFGDAGSCILTSDERLIVWGGRGKLAVVDTAVLSPTQYSELARRENVLQLSLDDLAIWQRATKL